MATDHPILDLLHDFAQQSDLEIQIVRDGCHSHNVQNNHLFQKTNQIPREVHFATRSEEPSLSSEPLIREQSRWYSGSMAKKSLSCRPAMEKSDSSSDLAPVCKVQRRRASITTAVIRDISPSPPCSPQIKVLPSAA